MKRKGSGHVFGPRFTLRVLSQQSCPFTADRRAVLIRFRKNPQTKIITIVLDNDNTLKIFPEILFTLSSKTEGAFFLRTPWFNWLLNCFQNLQQKTRLLFSTIKWKNFRKNFWRNFENFFFLKIGFSNSKNKSTVSRNFSNFHSGRCPGHHSK